VQAKKRPLDPNADHANRLWELLAGLVAEGVLVPTTIEAASRGRRGSGSMPGPNYEAAVRALEGGA
jgi:hypothetical protein